LRQGEVISDLTQYIFDPVTENVTPVLHPYSIVLSQDCDLLRDYESRTSGSGSTVPSVLLYVADIASTVRPTIGPDIWRRVIGNNNERYHIVSAVPVELDLMNQGIVSLIIDFRTFFTMTPEEVYRQCSTGQAHRRCRLEMPYREHLQSRAAFYLQRVGLPNPHVYNT
jgi:hypothetical protein